MSLLTQQLERLNEEKRNLEKRIEEEEQKKIKLKKQSIRYLEELIKPLTNRLDVTGTVVLTNNISDNSSECNQRFENGKDIKRSFRDTQTEIYNDNLKLFKINKQQIEERTNKMQLKENYVFIPPRKAKPLVEEEIYTTIIGILKKQEQEIQDLKQQLIQNNISPKSN